MNRSRDFATTAARPSARIEHMFEDVVAESPWGEAATARRRARLRFRRDVGAAAADPAVADLAVAPIGRPRSGTTPGAGRAGARLRQVRAVGVAGAGPGLGHRGPGPAVGRHVDRGDRRVRPARLVGGRAAGPAARRAGPRRPADRAPVFGAVGGGGQRVRPRRGRGGAAPVPGYRVRADRVGPAAARDAARHASRCGSPGGSTPRRPGRSTTPPWCCPTSTPGPCEAGCCPRRRSRPWPSSRRRWPGR